MTPVRQPLFWWQRSSGRAVSSMLRLGLPAASHVQHLGQVVDDVAVVGDDAARPDAALHQSGRSAAAPDTEMFTPSKTSVCSP